MFIIGANSSYVMTCSSYNLSNGVQVDLRNWASANAVIRINISVVYYANGYFTT